jgi:cytochrome c-type biogenesis protein CcmF
MTQERMGMFKRWNMVLIILTYCLVIFGTFLTRSGVLSSVHAFSQSSIGPVFLVFIALTFAVSLGLLLWRGVICKIRGLCARFSRVNPFFSSIISYLSESSLCACGV